MGDNDDDDDNDDEAAEGHGRTDAKEWKLGMACGLKARLELERAADAVARP